MPIEGAWLKREKGDCELVTENYNSERCTMDINISATHGAGIHIHLAEHRDSCTGYSRKATCLEGSANLAKCGDSSEGDLGSSV